MGCDVDGVPSQKGPLALVQRGLASGGFTRLYHSLSECVIFYGLAYGFPLAAGHFPESVYAPRVPVILVTPYL